jgi:hypothetical protein
MSPVLPADPASVRFSLVLPATWTVLDLDPKSRNRSIERMIRHAVGTADRLASFRRSAVTLYRRVLSDAADAGAFFAATLAQTVGDRPLTGSALAFLGLLPRGADGEPMTPDDMVAVLASPGAGEVLGEGPDLIELPIGRAVRVRGRTGSGLTGTDGREPPIDVTRFFIPIPSWDMMLVMAFSTPILPAADAFAELFDQLALTARWQITE